MRKEKGVRGILLPDFRLQYEATVISVVLAQKYIYRSMKKIKSLEKKSMYLMVN